MGSTGDRVCGRTGAAGGERHVRWPCEYEAEPSQPLWRSGYQTLYVLRIFGRTDAVDLAQIAMMAVVLAFPPP